MERCSMTAAAAVLALLLFQCCAAEHQAADSRLRGRQLLRAKPPRGCPNIVIPWGNPDVLALYKTRSPNGKLVRPYRKWFKLQSGVYFYKTVTGAKKNCPVVFDWRVPPNAVSTLHNLRGVVYSRKGVCQTNPKDYTVTQGGGGQANERYISRSVTPRHTGKYYFWDSSHHLAHPEKTGNPYSQYWLSCQFGVYVTVKVT